LRQHKFSRYRATVIAATKYVPLHKEANIVENLFTHLDVAQLGCMRELQFFSKPVKNSGIEIGPLVQEQQQFSGCGRVLVVGLETTRSLYGDGHRKGAKITAVLLG
jgi:hypothetical protein